MTFDTLSMHALQLNTMKNILRLVFKIVWLGSLIVFLADTDKIIAQSATIQGIVTDQVTGQPLEGANITVQIISAIQFRGMASDRNGFYQITGLDAGEYAVRISFVGYIAHSDTLILAENERKTVSAALVPDEEELDEIVVAPPGTGAAQLQAGRQRVSVTDIQRVPTPAASGDMASYLQAMPGVVAAGDRGGELYIRGGMPSENMVLVDGTMIFRPFHIVGFFSVFPSDLVSHADIYAGGFGPRYNGRISSLIDVRMRDGDRYQAAGSASVSPFIGEVVVESPITKGETSMIASVRRSMIEETSPWFLGEQQPIMFESQYLKLTHFGVEDTRCSALLLRTNDRGRLDFEQGEVFRWNNLIVGGSCVMLPPGSSMVFDMNAGISHMSNSAGSISSPERSSKVTRFNLDTNLIRYIGETRLEYGLFVHIKTLNYSLRELFHAQRTDNIHIFSPGAYMELSTPVLPGLLVRPGLSVTSYRETYQPTIQPRFLLSWQPFGRDEEELNVSFGLYRQHLAGVSDTRDVGSSFVAWMVSPVGEAQMESIHSVLSWRQAIIPGLHLSVEAYHKSLKNMPVTVWSTIARFNTDLALARGNVFGGDLRLEYNRNPIYAFLGYGVSRTEYIAAQDHFNTWFGEPIQRYYPPHDRRHQINAQFAFDFGRYTTSLRWQLGTGMPFTRPIGFDELHRFSDQLPEIRDQYGTPRVILDRPYQGRTPIYHRLDMSIRRSFNFPFARLDLQIGAINAYDHNNLFYYDVYTHRRIDQLPFAPYFSLKMETKR